MHVQSGSLSHIDKYAQLQYRRRNDNRRRGTVAIDLS